MGYRLLKDELMRALALVGQGSDFEGKCEKRTIEGFYQTKCYLFAFDGKNGRTKSIGADYCSISG